MHITIEQSTSGAASREDMRLVEALRRGDERAFTELVDRHSRAMSHVARSYSPTRQVAEEAVQETWIAVLNGIDRFEGRSALRTWIFQILLNRVRAAALREQRTVPF